MSGDVPARRTGLPADAATANTAATSGRGELTPPTPPGPRGVRELAGGFVIALVALAVFGLVATSFSNQEEHALDTFASPFLHSMASPALDVLMNAITTLGTSPVLLLIAAGAVVLLVARGRPTHALFLATAGIGSVLLDGALKVIVHRARPQLPWAHVQPDYSFPSGHTMNTVSLLLALALLVWVTRGPRTGSLAVVAALAVALAIGLSRVYLGYHYVSDVVGGLAAGIAWILVVALAFEVGPRTVSRFGWTRRGRAAK